jgi:serine/threonine protein kinase
MLKPHRRAEVEFEYLIEIGQDGQNSRTHVSQDYQLNAQIVIKEISKAKLDAGRFFDEARALYATAHPNVVQIHYSCEDNDNVYVAMPYYQMKSLKDLMSQRFLTVREVVTLGCQVLAGLHHVHSKRLVHFDIKPDNILLSDRGEALVSDFGQARPLGPANLAEQDRRYLKIQPPEGFGGYQFPRTYDIYQVGLLLYRMCNGDIEFYRQFDAFGPVAAFDRIAFRVAVVNGQFPDRAKFLPHIPERLRALVRKCLEVDPAQRFSSALEVGNALALVEGETLDWQYSSTPAGRRWTKNTNGTYYEFEVADAGPTLCHKTAMAGQRRRFNEGCKDGMTDRQVRTFLGDH